MTVFYDHSGAISNTDPERAVYTVNVIANHPSVHDHIGPSGVPHDLTAWVTDPDNLTVLFGLDDAALFIRETADTWAGHFLFTSARGAEAKALARRAIGLLFDTKPAWALIGDVPEGYKAARVMARAIGCSPAGTSVDCLGRACIRYELRRGTWADLSAESAAQ